MTPTVYLLLKYAFIDATMCVYTGDVVKKSPQAAPPMAAGGTQGDDDIDAPEVTEILKTDAMKKVKNRFAF